jgi:hypothetical protein
MHFLIIYTGTTCKDVDCKVAFLQSALEGLPNVASDEASLQNDAADRTKLEAIILILVSLIFNMCS